MVRCVVGARGVGAKGLEQGHAAAVPLRHLGGVKPLVLLLSNTTPPTTLLCAEPSLALPAGALSYLLSLVACRLPSSLSPSLPSLPCTPHPPPQPTCNELPAVGQPPFLYTMSSTKLLTGLFQLVPASLAKSSLSYALLPPHPLPQPTCDELPAVVLPPFLNTVGSLASVSMVVSALTPSSSVTVTMVSEPVLGSTT